MDDESGVFALGIAIGIFLFILLTASLGELSGIHVNQETANDICSKITGNESAIGYTQSNGASFWSDTLRCEVPSYDSTQNIVVKYNNE